MNAEKLAAIRERDADAAAAIWPTEGDEDRHGLLAHIDTLTAKVEGLPEGSGFSERVVSAAAVLAILRGEA